MSDELNTLAERLKACAWGRNAAECEKKLLSAPMMHGTILEINEGDAVRYKRLSSGGRFRLLKVGLEKR